MASLPESSTFDAGVYQLELTDPVIGGPSGVSNTPLKNLANRTKYLKDHVDALESSRAPLASPAFTGTPTVPTATAGTNNTQAASTAFVKAAVDAKDLSAYAPLASPAFTGSPTAPAAAFGDSDTSIANTAFVQRAIGNFSGYVGVIAAATLDASYCGKHVICGGTAGYTVTLPAANSVPAGSTISFFSAATGGNGVVQIAAPVGSVLGDGHSVITCRLALRDNAEFVSFGTEWRLYSGTAQWAYSTTAQSAILPSGLIAHFASSYAPTGWLKANGALVSRTTYGALFAAIGTTHGAGDGSTTFKLPDLRGEFIRGWDDGRGIDSGREFGSAQSQAIQQHNHQVVTWNGSTASGGGIASASGGGGGIYYDRYTENTGGAETRPRNIALLACIKY